jgi:peroxiredoxin
MRRQAAGTGVHNLLKQDAGWLLRAGMIACALVALALILITRVTTPNATTARLIGRQAPGFTLPAAQGGAMLPDATHFMGTSVRPTLLVFFNTLCVHCLSEINAARQVTAEDSSGAFNIIYIDTPGENAEITSAYMARLQINPPVLLDTGGAVAHEYHASYSPTVVLIDQHGVIRGVWVGETPATTLAAGIQSALGS